MVWICDKCTEDQHVSCKSQWRCDCKCNIGGNVDITQKGLAIVGGTALAVTGLAITLCTGGLAAAIVGSAMLGAGFGSTWNATAKTIKGERIDGNIYVNDVAFGCVAGVVTSRLGATTETITTNLVQQIVTVGTQKLSESSDMDTDDEIQPSSTTDKQCADTKNELIAVQLYAASIVTLFFIFEKIFSLIFMMQLQRIRKSRINPYLKKIKMLRTFIMIVNRTNKRLLIDQLLESMTQIYKRKFR